MRSKAEAAAAAAALALALAAGGARAEGGGVRLLVQNSPLAGFRYAEAAAVWPLMREGDALELVREPDNPHDANAVRVEWRGRKLGYVPRRENAALAWALDRGVPVTARIARMRAHPNPARRLELEVLLE
jgi:hypothetical protein